MIKPQETAYSAFVDACRAMRRRFLATHPQRAYVPFTIAVTGGRDFQNWEMLDAALGTIQMLYPISSIVHGNATGADKMAEMWAQRRMHASRALPADWKKLGPKVAGPARNEELKQILLAAAPNAILVAMPGGNGTADMVIRTRQAGIEVIDVADFITE